MPRKSSKIAVSVVKQFTNEMLVNEKLTDDARIAVAQLLEKILFETNNYNGFGYKEWLDEGGFERWNKDGQLEGPEKEQYFGNQTRKIYY